MSKIVLHRLSDWPVFRHARPLLEALGVERESLDFWHFYSSDQLAIHALEAAAPEHRGRPQELEPLIALSDALSELGRCFSDAEVAGDLHVAFHDAASKTVLQDAATRADHEPVLAADVVWSGKTSPDHISPDCMQPLLAAWEAEAIKRLVKSSTKGMSSAILGYINRGGRPPDLEPTDGATLEFHRDVSSLTGRHERLLDVFVALSGGRSCPRWSSSGERGAPWADSAGLLRDALVARGVSDAVIFDELCAPAPPGSSQRPFGHKEWKSRAYLQASFYARLDEVVAWGPGKAAALFRDQSELPNGLRVLTGMVAEKWCRAGGFARLDLQSLAACSRLLSHDSGNEFVKEAALVYRERVLSRVSPTLAELVQISYDFTKAGELPPADAKRFGSAVASAVAGAESTLADWELARLRGIIDPETFAKGVLAPFGRALAVDFRSGEHGFGDQEGFMAAARAVAASDPDLCLRGFTALTFCFNERGLRAHVDDWDSVLPKTGYSGQALADASASFSLPSRRSAARILKTLLAARKIAVAHPAPPMLENIDASFRVGTDVAHLIIGSYSAVEAVSGQEDPDDWPVAMKKQSCAGVETGADGNYVVRVMGARTAAAVKAGSRGTRHIATFPLRIGDDSLTVSGIVGAGGTPTISFPSGSFAAEIFVAKGGEVVVFVTRPKTLPKWTFKKDLPHLG